MVMKRVYGKNRILSVIRGISVGYCNRPSHRIPLLKSGEASELQSGKTESEVVALSAIATG